MFPSFLTTHHAARHGDRVHIINSCLFSSSSSSSYSRRRLSLLVRQCLRSTVILWRVTSGARGWATVARKVYVLPVGRDGGATYTEFSDASVEMALNVHKSTPFRENRQHCSPRLPTVVHYSLFCFFFILTRFHPHTPQPPRSVLLSGGRNRLYPINRLRAYVPESAMFEQHSARLILLLLIASLPRQWGGCLRGGSRK